MGYEAIEVLTIMLESKHLLQKTGGVVHPTKKTPSYTVARMSSPITTTPPPRANRTHSL